MRASDSQKVAKDVVGVYLKFIATTRIVVGRFRLTKVIFEKLYSAFR